VVVEAIRNIMQSHIVHGLRIENRFRRYLGLRIPKVPLSNLVSQGFLNVRLESFIGFFAQISWVLPFLDYCEEEQLIPNIELTGHLYSVPERGRNWLAHHFQVPPNHSRIGRTFQNICEIEFPERLVETMTIRRANFLVKKYLPVHTDHLHEVECFVATKFSKADTLGIHYRGTDKVGNINDPGIEAPRLAWEDLKNRIDCYLNDNPMCRTIFVASDERAMKETVADHYRDQEVVTFDDTQISRDGKAIHLNWSEGDNFQKGREAVINSLLLSRCKHLIRTSSFLSAFSVVFNPLITTETLNRPYEGKLWFPDREIFDREACKTGTLCR
jgi:hypothetical protein